MKPICGKCNLFMRMARAGEYFEERMPGPNAAKREVRPREFGGGMHCGICGPDHPCHGHPLLERVFFGDVEPLTVKPGELEGWQPYKLWVGDLRLRRGSHCRGAPEAHRRALRIGIPGRHRHGGWRETAH